MTAALLGRTRCMTMRNRLWCLLRPGHPGEHVDCLGRTW
jgi:hypothetical protein